MAYAYGLGAKYQGDDQPDVNAAWHPKIRHIAPPRQWCGPKSLANGNDICVRHEYGSLPRNMAIMPEADCPRRQRGVSAQEYDRHEREKKKTELRVTSATLLIRSNGDQKHDKKEVL